MIDSIQYTGSNAQDVCSRVTGLKLEPHELKGGFWIRQWANRERGSFRYSLTMPAREGDVDLWPGDWAVQEQDGRWVRLSPEQFETESKEPPHDV